MYIKIHKIIYVSYMYYDTCIIIYVYVLNQICIKIHIYNIYMCIKVGIDKYIKILHGIYIYTYFLICIIIFYNGNSSSY